MFTESLGNVILTEMFRVSEDQDQNVLAFNVGLFLVSVLKEDNYYNDRGDKLTIRAESLIQKYYGDNIYVKGNNSISAIPITLGEHNGKLIKAIYVRSVDIWRYFDQKGLSENELNCFRKYVLDNKLRFSILCDDDEIEEDAYISLYHIYLIFKEFNQSNRLIELLFGKENESHDDIKDFAKDYLEFMNLDFERSSIKDFYQINIESQKRTESDLVFMLNKFILKESK